MKLGNRVEYKPYNRIGCYTRVYVHGVMYQIVHKMVEYHVTSKILFNLEVKVANNRIIINEIR